VALRPNAGHGLLIAEVSRSHSDAPQSVGLLWTSDQLVAEILVSLLTLNVSCVTQLLLLILLHLLTAADIATFTYCC
jgi:hypothetical protein